MSTKLKVALKEQPQRIPRVRLDSLKNPQPRAIPQTARPFARRVQSQTPRNIPPQCTNAACDKSDVASEGGHLLCRNCGTVIREENITSEIVFGESSNGAAVVQGAFLGADQSYSRISAPGGSKIAGGMDSRGITEANGKRLMKSLCNALQLAESYVDSGMQIYKLALGNNFVQGRRTNQVAAVCLYTACRRSQDNKVMLIDLADILRINVFKLGHTYSSLIEVLCFRETGGIEPINPESLIYRFAQKLEFGEATYRVAKEAVQVLSRMDRDWMMTGRRPSGVCGAALILAARMNNFRRTVREVVYVVKVTDMTIHKRLEEFKFTPSSELTVAEFRNHGDTLGSTCDPPAFYEQFLAPKKKRRKRTHQGTAEDEQDSDNEVDRAISMAASISSRISTPATARQAQADSQAMPPPPIPIDPALLAISASKFSELTVPDASEASAVIKATREGDLKRKRGRPAGAKNKPLPTPSASQLDDESAIESEISSVLADSQSSVAAGTLRRALEPQGPASPAITQEANTTTNPNPTSEAARTESPPTTQRDLRPNPSPGTENQVLQSTELDIPPSTQPPPSQASSLPRPPIPDTEIIPEEEFADDPEVVNCLLTPSEVEIKERIWVHENADFLRAQQAKMIRKQLEEANGTARVIVKRKRRRGRMGDMSVYQKVGEDGTTSGPQTPAEATAAMLAHRGYSTKINYAAVERLYESSSSGRGGSRGGSVAESQMESSGASTPLMPSRQGGISGDPDGDADVDEDLGTLARRFGSGDGNVVDLDGREEQGVGMDDLEAVAEEEDEGLEDDYVSEFEGGDEEADEEGEF